MYKRLFPISAPASDGSAAGGSAQFPGTPVQPQPRARSDSWFEAMAQAWADTMDKQASQVVALSDELGTGRDDPGTAIQLQAQAQKMAFLATAASTSTNTVGNALETLAKKQ
jgi:hypothetical protein